MTRGTLLVLLILTNAAWCGAWLLGGGFGAAPDSEDAARDAERDDHGDEAPRDAGAGTSRTSRDDRGASALLLPGEQDGDVTLYGREGATEIAGEVSDDPGAPDAESPEAAAARAALEEATDTLRKIAQVKDPAARQEGLAELTATLSSGSPIEIEYALGILHRLRTLGLGLDLTGMKSLVLSHMESESPGIRRSALYALLATGTDPSDARLVLAAAEDPDPLVRGHVTRLLRQYTGGELDAEAAAVIVDLLSDEDEQVRRASMQGFWNATVPPEVERALLEAAARPDDRRAAVQHGLAPLENKSRDVVDALFTYLDDDDRRVRERAHWGLQRGVPEPLRPYVAERYAGHLEEFLNPRSQREALQVIARFGDASLVPQLTRFAENEMVSMQVRRWARRAAEHLAR